MPCLEMGSNFSTVPSRASHHSALSYSSGCVVVCAVLQERLCAVCAVLQERLCVVCAVLQLGGGGL